MQLPAEAPWPSTPHTAAVEQLTREFLAHLYQHDLEWCLDQCAADIVLIGSTHNSRAAGVNDVKSTLEELFSDVDLGYVTTCQLYSSRLPHTDMVRVVANYYVSADPAVTHTFTTEKIATLLWTMADGKTELCHFHASMPIDEPLATKGETFLSNRSYAYARSLLDQLIKRTTLTIRDVTGTTHYISSVEVRYVEASKQRTVLHCLERGIVVRRGFKETVALFGDDLITVHRSFAINPLYIRTISADFITLDDGSMIPIPQRRSLETRSLLTAAMNKLVYPQRASETTSHTSSSS